MACRACTGGLIKRMRWLAEAILLAAVAFVKSIPAVGFAPWACALTDAVFLVLLLARAQREKWRAVFLAAFLMPLFDWVQGCVPGYWVPFIAVGFFLAAYVWGRMDSGRVMRAVLSVQAAYILRSIGIATGYVLLKDMRVWMALRTVVRNSWFVFAWYAAAVALYALADAHMEQKKSKRLQQERL